LPLFVFSHPVLNQVLTGWSLRFAVQVSGKERGRCWLPLAAQRIGLTGGKTGLLADWIFSTKGKPLLLALLLQPKQAEREEIA
jgi:hypothetical protein